MRHPGISGVHVVFYEEQRAIQLQERAYVAQDFFMILEVVQGICHHDPIQRRQGQTSAEVRANGMNVLGGRKSFTVYLFQLPERPLVFIHRIDAGMRPDQLAQRQGEGARPCTEVCPGASG